MARERELNFKLNVKSVNAEAMKTAFRGVTQELDRQQQKAASLKRTMAAVQPGAAGKPLAAAMSGIKLPALPGFSLGDKGGLGGAAPSAPGGGMKGIGGMLGGGGFGAGLGGLGGGLSSLAGVAGPAGMALTAVAAGITALTKAATSLGGAASPAALQRYELAMQDTSAVLGRIFVPLLEHMGDAMRLVGDVLASVLPSTDEMREAMAPFREALVDMKKIFTDLAPAIRVFLKASLQVAAMFARITVAIGLFQIRTAAWLAGLDGTGKELQSSMGAAKRNINFTSAEDYAKQVYKAAFSAQAGKDPTQAAAEASASHLGNIAANVGKILAAITAGGQAVGQAAGYASTAAGLAVNPAGTMADVIRGAVIRGLQGG